MLLSCDQKDLLAALTTVSKAVNLNSTLPVLNNILLKAESKKLTFAATNLEIAITTSINTEIKNEIKGEFSQRADLLPQNKDAKIFIKPNLNSNMNALTGNTTGAPSFPKSRSKVTLR